MGTKKDDKSTAPKPRPRGELEGVCFKITCDLLDGNVDLPGRTKVITPHAVGRLAKERLGLEKAPSTGAIAANFSRWGDYGVVTLGAKPQQIKGFTSAFVKASIKGGGYEAALTHFKTKHRHKLQVERAKTATPEPDAPAKKKTGARKPK